MTKVKLWVTDIDGTIMNYDGSYTPEMKKLICDIQKAGIKFVLATGRMYMGAEYVAKQFGINTPVICYQGAMVRTKEEILWQAPISKILVNDVIDFLHEKKIHTHVYDNDVLYVEDDNKRIMHEYCDNRGTTYQVIDDFKKLPLNSVSKVLGVIENADLMQKIKEELQEKYKNKLTIVQSSDIYLEITDKNASKGAALRFLKKYWNLSDSEVIASGDQDNDIELIKEAGIRACVGGKSEELLKLAHYCAKDVNSNELVKIIKDIAL